MKTNRKMCLMGKQRVDNMRRLIIFAFTISLTGAFGFTSSDLSTLFNLPSAVWL